MTEKIQLSPYSRAHRWHDVTIEEMYVFLALSLLMPHVRKHCMKDYWSINTLIETPSFGKYMTRDRYLAIMQYLHFREADTPVPEGAENDRLLKIRPYVRFMQKMFASMYNPGQKLIIDESLILFRGRVGFQQYIPSKRHRFGLKFFVLCDCESGFVLNFIIYTGTNIDYPEDKILGMSGSIVKTLLAKYLDKGHILYTDNWYTSPTLATYLHEKNTGSCGTVKTNRKNMPKFQPTKKGECHPFEFGPLLAIKWTDKRDVHMITTIHTGAMKDSGKYNHRTNEIKYKPDAVIDYNINMRLVDKSDMMITTIDTNRRTVKWYKKIFFHLQDISIYNAYIMFKKVTKKK